MLVTILLQFLVHYTKLLARFGSIFSRAYLRRTFDICDPDIFHGAGGRCTCKSTRTGLLCLRTILAFGDHSLSQKFLNLNLLHKKNKAKKFAKGPMLSMVYIACVYCLYYFLHAELNSCHKKRRKELHRSIFNSGGTAVKTEWSNQNKQCR